MNLDKHYDAIVIGGGPAGLTAGIYLSLNKRGEIITGNDMSTSLKGVYAAGDSTAKRYRQITTAVSDGTSAALSASEYLNRLKKEEKQLISN